MTEVIHEPEIGRFLKAVRPQLKRFAGKKIAIKIHFGEPGNRTAFTPEQIKPITDLLRKLEVKFFFYDSSVAYSSPRSRPESHKQAALAKGWGALGEVRTDDDFVEIKGKHMAYEVCRPLLDADGVLVITHVKGHQCPGFGGAIKNLGMGAVSKKSKSAIHEGAKPVFIAECDGCGICAENCPFGVITIRKGRADFSGCFGCSNCIVVCPKGAISPKAGLFWELLAEAAHVAASRFKDAYYISVLNTITFQCDCWMDSREIIAPDCGYLASEDPVAIDKATHDIITAAAGEDVFLKHHKRTGLRQVEAAEGLGMGAAEYILR